MSAPPQRPTPLALPRITVQPTLPLVIQEIKDGLHGAEDTWVSCYLEASPSVHGRLRVSEVEGGGDVELEGREGVQVVRVSNTEVLVTCEKLGIPATPVQFPLATPFVLRGGIDVFDISPDGDKFVVGGKEGVVRVGNTRGGGKVVELRGAVSDIRDVAFFPSGEVVLTASSDMSLRVFSAIDGTNPRVLTGHTRAVTALHILGKGRQVVSASLDGSLIIWNVAAATPISTIRFTQPIHALAIGSILTEDPIAEAVGNELPRGQIAIVGHSNGSASVIDLSLSTPPIRELAAGSSPLFAVAYDPKTHLVAAGSRNGTISIFDLSRPAPLDGSADGPILSFMRSTSPISSLSFSVKGPTLLVGTEDGLPCRISLGLESGDGQVKVLEEFVGGDCENVVVREREGAVWIGAGDGALRRFASTS